VSSSEKQKESIIRAELKRCMSIERRWNRNEVSRESPNKEVNRRPTYLKNIIIMLLLYYYTFYLYYIFFNLGVGDVGVTSFYC